MGFRMQDLPAYVLIGAVLFFFGYVIIQSWRQEKKEQDKEPPKK